MTIDIQEISHATTPQALSYAMDYYATYYVPGEPPISYHRYDHSEHIEVLATWGYQGYFFVQSRIKLTVLYALVADWTDEIAVRGWVFWRNPITGTWHVEVESEATSVHHWQEAHTHIKQEATQMALKRARIDQYYPGTHKADVTIYPLPGEPLAGVPLAQECGPELAALLPDCTLAIFYDTVPPSPYITSLLNGIPPPWVTSALVKDGEIAEADLAFDPATQAELNIHAGIPSVHHEQLTPAQHDARDHSPVAPTVALAELGSKAHAELTGIAVGDHHAELTPAQHDARDHTPIAATIQLAELGSKTHAELATVLPDQHHPQAHALASHTTKAHAELTGVSADQHHKATLTAIARCTGRLTLTTADLPIAGCTLWLLPGYYIIIGVFHFSGNNQGAHAIGSLYLDGARQGWEAAYQPAATAWGRATVTQVWRVHLTATTTLQLKAKKTAAVGIFRALNPETTITSIQTADLS